MAVDTLAPYRNATLCADNQHPAKYLIATVCEDLAFMHLT